MSVPRIIAVVKSEARFGPEGMSLWRLTGVSPGRSPTWFRKIVDRDFDGIFNRDWFDHFGLLDNALVAEPYHLDEDSLRDLLEFADRYSLSISISGTSAHYPTRTVSVLLSPRDA
jgi:hypothetical protein